MNQVAVQFSFPRMVTLLPRVDCRVSRQYISWYTVILLRFAFNYKIKGDVIQYFF